MRKNIINFLIGAVTVIAVVFAVAVVIDGQDSGGPDMNGPLSSSSSAQVGNSTPDAVSISQLPDGDNETVKNNTGGYSFTMPTNWYLENNTGEGVTVYPDYDPKSGDAPTCKIEVSSFGSAAIGSSAGSLNDWITRHLHADPTADISESSRTDLNVGGSSAIEWQGSLNGVTTTLVYVSTPTGDLLEFAPSTLATPDDPDADDCGLALQAMLSNIQFGNTANQ